MYVKMIQEKLIQIVMIQVISIMASQAIKRTWSLLAEKQLYIDQKYYYFFLFLLEIVFCKSTLLRQII